MKGDDSYWFLDFVFDAVLPFLVGIGATLIIMMLALSSPGSSGDGFKQIDTESYDTGYEAGYKKAVHDMLDRPVIDGKRYF